MSTEPTNPPAGSNWGDAAPAPEPGATKGWTGRKTAIAVGVAVLIVAGGGVAIAVGTSGSSTTAQQGPGQGGPGGFPGGFQNGATGGAAALRDAVHGDFVVPDNNGGYTNERLQTGDVTAISATSISLTSKDGYKQTYTLDGSTQKTSDPKTGESVTVIAKISGDTATATSVTSGTMSQRGQRGQGGFNRQGGAPGAAPAPGGN
jgi:hypothetical protein